MSEEKILQDKFRDYMYRNNIKQVDIARMLNISTGTVSEWMSGKKYPNRTKRKLIKEKLGIVLNEPIEESPPDSYLASFADPSIALKESKLPSAAVQDRLYNLVLKIAASLPDDADQGNDEKELLRKYRMLSEVWKEHIHTILDWVIEEEKE